ncbi:hypothetical protein ACFX2F_045262 [Malus domestica]
MDGKNSPWQPKDKRRKKNLFSFLYNLADNGAESLTTILFFSGGSEPEYKAVGLWRSATTKKREIKSKSLNSGNRIRPPIPNGRPKEERSRAVLTLPHPLLPLAKQRPPKQKIKVGLLKKFIDPPPIPLTKKKPKKW